MATQADDRTSHLPVTIPILVGIGGALLWIVAELMVIFAPQIGIANQVAGVALVLVTALPAALVVAQGPRAFVLGYFGAILTAGSYFTIGLINFFTPTSPQMMETAETSPVFGVAGGAYLIGPVLLAISIIWNNHLPRTAAFGIIAGIILIGVGVALRFSPQWDGAANILLCLAYLALARGALKGAGRD